uniref:FLYWCH-type domain-containing protein n=1 Tax=Trichuris muris TaxID=70415 RepID=A0A5S6QFT7_TRIMR
MKPRNDADVERFYLELHGALNVLRARGRSVELKSAYTLQVIIPKMTGYLRQKWAQKVFDLRPREATLEDLDFWLEQIILVNRLVEPVEVNGREAENAARRPSRIQSNCSRRRLNVTTVVSNSATCALCQGSHLLSNCPEFVKCTPNRRTELVRDVRLCFACLNGTHEARRCPERVRCDVAHSNRRHHPLLHGSFRVYPPVGYGDDGDARDRTSSPGKVQTANIGANTIDHDTVCLSMVPVTVMANGASVRTFALLDPGSQGTLITDEMARDMNLARAPSDVRLLTFHGQDPLLEGIDWLTLDYCVSCGIMEYVCELVPSLRGCAKLTVDGYFFVKDKCRGEKYYWCCESRKSLYCNARAVTRVVDGRHILMSSLEHNHLPKPSGKGVLKAVVEVKEQARNTRDLPCQIIQSCTTSAHSSVSAQLPSADALRQTIHRIRRGQRPSEPRTLAEVDVSSILENTSGCGRLLIKDAVIPEGRLLLFITAYSVEKLANASFWLMDGTS